MEGEPKFEQEKQKVYSVQFDNEHFGEIKRPIGTLSLVAEMNDWWKNTCTQNGLDHEEESKRCKNADYYMMELGKNALEYGGGEREIKILFEENKITVVVTDNGAGIDNPNKEIEFHPEHGLSVVKKFADEFTVESRGKKFTKIKKKIKLLESQDTDVTQGTKITFIRNLE